MSQTRTGLIGPSYLRTTTTFRGRVETAKDSSNERDNCPLTCPRTFQKDADENNGTGSFLRTRTTFRGQVETFECCKIHPKREIIVLVNVLEYFKRTRTRMIKTGSFQRSRTTFRGRVETAKCWKIHPTREIIVLIHVLDHFKRTRTGLIGQVAF